MAPKNGSSKQATLGKFFGKPGSSGNERKQSTLSFTPRQKKQASKDNSAASDTEMKDAPSTAQGNDQDDEDVEMKLRTSDVEMEDDTAAKSSPTTNARKKRNKSPPAQLKTNEENQSSDSDVQPTSKRRRRQSKPDAKTTMSETVGTTETPISPPKKRGRPSKTPSPPISSHEPSPAKDSSPDIEKVSVSNSSGQEEELSMSESEVEALEETKPELAKKTAAKVQKTLKSTGKDPYPDWKPGEPVPYAALCTTFSLIEMTTKRLAILEHCSLFLRQVLRLTPGDLLSTVQLMINKLAADYAGIELGIGESLIMKAIGESTGRSLSVIKADQQEIGDLGLVAAKSRSNQPTMFKPKPLTVRGVHEQLLQIAQVQGHGSQDRKVSGIKKLLSAADAHSKGKVDITKNKGGPSEAKYIIRFLEGKLRLGLAEKTALVALAHAVVSHEMEVAGKSATAEQLAQGESILKTVYSELPSYEVIVPAMLENGIFNLPDNCKLQPGVPLKPMLAHPTKSITEVLDRFEGKEFTCEYKYDGERAQIHYVANDALSQFPSAVQTSLQKAGQTGCSAIFSRNSEDLSKKYPDVLAKLETWIKPDVKSFVVDCETVAWDLAQKKVLPFQQLMTRKRKDVKAEDIKVKVCVFGFDLLFLNGEPTVKKSFRERRKLLHTVFQPVEGEFAFAQHGDTNELEEIQVLLDDSLKEGCEGLMVKMLDTEESAYEPSKRSRSWLKVKKDYLASSIGDSLDLVVLGAYYGRGKRTNWYGAYLLGAYNPRSQEYETICNIGTGFSEALLQELHDTLSPLAIEKKKPFYVHSSAPKDQPDVWFEPRLVWEVKAADLTLSPRYLCAKDDHVVEAAGGPAKGISLRFPRYIRGREDKKPEQATTTKQVAEMYKKQEVAGKEKSAKKFADDDFEY
ncbi:DNA ligase, ATP-dependent [Ascosphaera apis ARSEF 7405]|uniref:DNA ligase n=1 Tax=Ascosphaera apis ARSEF 7405 TaxID=392613 RepID=A0A167YGC6_9EURO|nr:DNA ligase, ATP-dependent [Ascosphaera apis ARSEF 7405]